MSWFKIKSVVDSTKNIITTSSDTYNIIKLLVYGSLFGIILYKSLNITEKILEKKLNKKSLKIVKPYIKEILNGFKESKKENPELLEGVDKVNIEFYREVVEDITDD